MRRFPDPLTLLEAQRGALFPWVAVFFGIGIGIYFSLKVEPTPNAYLLLGVAAVCLAILTRWFAERWGPLFIAAMMVCFGVMIAGAHAHLSTASVLGYRYYGPIEGRVIKIDRSLSDKVRLTLDRVVLRDMSPAATPERVRVSLHGQQGYIDPAPGMVVILTGHLSPPQGPAEPGGFDFRRMAWFQQLGAVGYTRSPVLTLSPPKPGAGLLVTKIRSGVARWVGVRLPGDVGAFATAIMTGDRSGISRETLDALRASNLAHLLAISGLHMGLLTGFVFSVLRYGLALWPGIGLRWPTKKIAACGALIAASIYLGLSGGNVATVRAFIMVAVMLVAVLFDRRALTLRAVAVAALIVLTLRPESLIGPGFQMSFAATAALVAVFGALRDWNGWRAPGWARPGLAVLLSSFVAGAATAPIAAAHFNQVAHFGLIANLLTVPLMGALVVPAAVLTMLLSPFGLGHFGLWLMAWGIRWIIGVAHWIAGQEGALSHVVTPGPTVLPLIALGGLFVILWQGRARLLGALLVGVGCYVWTGTERPALLISESGALFGVMTEDGRALNKPRGDGFVALSWLENDGDNSPQDAASERPGIVGERGRQRIHLGGVGFQMLSGRGADEVLSVACETGDWVVFSGEADVPPKPCNLLDQDKLRSLGSVAFSVRNQGLHMETAASKAGQRLWTQ
ncbi:ComEC/Rec2 family competence protein [Aliiroseovarius sp. YM-037]|uniref:ComEC/Rec2 family competence protein n=1 Tax=Aliiroseovarius sp. YM-037 TaxID=3341728 RepID=UPI003A80F516